MSDNIKYSLNDAHVSLNPNKGFVGAGGSLPLIDPVMEPGYLFLGWSTSSDWTGKYIQEVSYSDIPEGGTLTIYARIQAKTTVGIYGRTIPEELDPKYILTVDELESTKTRSLSAITKDNLASALVTHTRVAEVYSSLEDETSGSVTLDIPGVRCEYYLNLPPKVNKVLVNFGNIINSGTVVIHLSKYEYEYNQGFIEVALSGRSMTDSMSIGSTMVIKYDINGVLSTVHVYKAAESYLKIDEVVNDILEYRNYVHVCEIKEMGPDKNLVTLTVSKDDMDKYPDSSYKSVNLYFDNTKYNLDKADIATLQSKQGYFNLIDPQVTRVSMDDSTLNFEITYDQVPAYSSSNSTLNGYTKGIPVRLVMVR